MNSYFISYHGVALTDETDFFVDVHLALVEQATIETQSGHSMEEFVNVEARLGGNSPIFGLQRPGHPRRLVFNIRVGRLRLKPIELW